MLAIKLLAPIAIALGGWAAAKLARKLGAEETVIWEKRGRLLAKEALNYADRWAKKQDRKPTSEYKLEAALRYVLELEGRKTMSRDRIRTLIESELEVEAKLKNGST